MDKYDKKAAGLIERSYRTPEIVNQRLRTLAALALDDGEAVLDAGCGTGLLLEYEAMAVGASGRAEGIDSSDDMLAHARVRCAEFGQVGLRRGSVESLPFDDASFDALSCAQTLLYVDNLDAALHEYFRVLKTGGRIAIVETDWRGAILNHPEPVLTRRIFDAWDLAVANPNLPRRLSPMLRALGFVNLRVEAIPVLNAGYSERSFSTGMMENWAHSAQRRRHISEPEAQSWLQGVRETIDEEAYFFCVNRFLFVANK